MNYFKKFISDEILELIGSQSNVYAIKKITLNHKAELDMWLNLGYCTGEMGMPTLQLVKILLTGKSRFCTPKLGRPPSPKEIWRRHP